MWDKSPQDVTDEEYKEFYQALFHLLGKYFGFTYQDYPFNLKGIIYFQNNA